ncbi:hypothetical protein [Catenulispora rubra]|nr:hypothetical protein [Catenulispora rubra]
MIRDPPVETRPSPDRVRAASHNVNPDGFDSQYPKYPRGQPRM